MSWRLGGRYKLGNDAKKRAWVLHVRCLLLTYVSFVLTQNIPLPAPDVPVALSRMGSSRAAFSRPELASPSDLRHASESKSPRRAINENEGVGRRTVSSEFE